MLPPNLPSSFEGQHGNVRYFLKADIVRDWKWNHKVKQHIMVNGILDLNYYPSAQAPGESSYNQCSPLSLVELQRASALIG